MIVKITVTGKIVSDEPIEAQLELPPNWNPNIKEVFIVKGAISRLVDELSEHFPKISG